MVEEWAQSSHGAGLLISQQVAEFSHLDDAEEEPAAASVDDGVTDARLLKLRPHLLI